MRHGTAIRLLQLSGEPSIEAFALLLSRSDVRFGRNRLWRLRDELLRNVNEPLRSVLSRGRTIARVPQRENLHHPRGLEW